MDNARSVRHIQRVGDLGPEVEQLVHRQRLAFDAILQGLPSDTPSRCRAVFVFANVVDGANVGVV